MDSKRKEATLDSDYIGPIFPNSLVNMHRAIFLQPRVKGCTTPLMKTFLEDISPNNKIHTNIRTEDGYMWYTFIELPNSKGIVYIAIPRFNKYKIQNGLESERTSCVYTKKEMSLKEIEEIIEPFVSKMTSWAHSIRQSRLSNH